MAYLIPKHGLTDGSLLPNRQYLQGKDRILQLGLPNPINISDRSMSFHNEHLNRGDIIKTGFILHIDTIMRGP